MASGEHRSVTDPATQAVKVGKLEERVSQTERALTDLTGDVKKQLEGLHGKLDQLVTKESCKEQSTKNLETTQRYVTAAVEAVAHNKKPLLDRLKDKAAAITVIGGLILGVVAAMYEVAKFATSVEAMVKKSTEQVMEQTTAVQMAVKKEPVKVYVPYVPDEMSSPPAHMASKRPPTRRPRAAPPRRANKNTGND